MKYIDCSWKRCSKSKEKRQYWKITNDQRKKNYKILVIYGLEERKVMVQTLVSQQPTKETRTKKNPSRRKFFLLYHLKVDVLLHVCKQMFLSTFAIGEWTVQNWVENSHSSGIGKSIDKFPSKAKPINAEHRPKIVVFALFSIDDN